MKIKTYFKSLILMLGIFNILPVSAQLVIQADSATLQPMISRDSGGFSSCGVRAVVLDVGSDFMDGHDFSLAIRANSTMGLFKYGKLRLSASDISKGKKNPETVIPGPVKFWISKESEGVAILPKKIIPADTPGYILGVADIMVTHGAIMAIVNGENMQFVNHYKNESIDRVIAFSAKMSDKEMYSLLSCFDGMLKRINETKK